MTTLLLIRHGENDWIGKCLAGRLEGVHLNDSGRRQAEELALNLSSLPVEAVYSSPLERAMETAQSTARRIGLCIQPDELLQEVDFGELAGMTFDQLRDLPLWKEVHREPESVRYPGGESLREVQKRGVRAVEEMCDRHPRGVVLAFSHSDTIRLAMAHFLQMPLVAYHHLAIDPGSISVLFRTPKVVRVLGLNLPSDSPLKLKME